MKLQTSWIKSNFYVQVLLVTGVFRWNLWIFNNTFENTNNFVEHLQNRCYFFIAAKFIHYWYHFEKKSKKEYQNSTCQIHVPRWCMCLARSNGWVDTTFLSPIQAPLVIRPREFLSSFNSYFMFSNLSNIIFNSFLLISTTSTSLLLSLSSSFLSSLLSEATSFRSLYSFLSSWATKNLNRGGSYGLEVPVKYCLYGQEKIVQWLNKNLEIVKK